MYKKLISFLLIGFLAFGCVSSQSETEIPAEQESVPAVEIDPCQLQDASDFTSLNRSVCDVLIEPRYYSDYNFLGRRMNGYEESAVLVNSQTARALQAASDLAISKGFRLKIYDGYLPQRAIDEISTWLSDPDTSTKMWFYPNLDKEKLSEENWLSDKLSHSQGSSLDLTLYDPNSGKDLDMGSAFDFLDPISLREASEGLLPEQQANRALLQEIMTASGFTPQSAWWSFTLSENPFTDRYFDFPVNEDILGQQGCAVSEPETEAEKIQPSQKELPADPALEPQSEQEIDPALNQTGCTDQFELDGSGFVDLGAEMPELILEPRYHTTYNILGERIAGYEEPVILVARATADALRQAAAQAKALGYRLKIFDAYRPNAGDIHMVQWCQIPDDTRMQPYFYPNVAKITMPSGGYMTDLSLHNRGAALDMTLFDEVTGKEVDMGTPYDFLDERSHIFNTEGISAEQAANRNILQQIMLDSGFRMITTEWWHFELINEPFPTTYFNFPVARRSLLQHLCY